MIVRLHKQARTTPAIRAEIRATPASVSNPELAARYGVTLPHAVTHNSHGINKYCQTNLQVIDYHNQGVVAAQARIIQ